MRRIITLQEAIEDSIVRSPTLYKMKTFEESKISVLNHLFLVNGNGYEWDERGFLFSYEDKKLKKLPKDFFEKDIYKLNPYPKEFYKIFEEYSSSELKERGIIKRNNQYFGKRKQAFDDYGGKLGIYPQPYPICQYARLVTIPDSILPDWLEGAIEVSRWAYNFYKTPELYTRSFYWQPAQRKGFDSEIHFKAWEAHFLKEQLNYLKTFFKRFHVKP